MLILDDQRKQLTRHCRVVLDQYVNRGRIVWDISVTSRRQVT